MTYTVIVTFIAGRVTDAHLQHRDAVEREVRSWLEGLGATVQTVVVKRS